MNDAMAVDLLYALLIAIPGSFLGPLTVYFISRTLRYKMRGIRWVYLISVITGIVASGFMVLMRGENGSVEISGKVLVVVLSQILILYGALVVSMEGKWWKGSSCPSSLWTSSRISGISLSSLKAQFFVDGQGDNKVAYLAIFAVTEILIMILELMFFAMIARMRKEKDEEALPVPVLLALSIILTIATGIGFNDRDNMELASITCLLYPSEPQCPGLRLPALLHKGDEEGEGRLYCTEPRQ